MLNIQTCTVSWRSTRGSGCTLYPLLAMTSAIRKPPLQQLIRKSTLYARATRNTISSENAKLIPLLLPQPFEVKGTTPEKMHALRHQGSSHNQFQAQAQIDEQLLLWPICPSQQHIHHMVQWFPQDFLLSYQQLDLHPAHYQKDDLFLPNRRNKNDITYHHRRFNGLHKFTIAVINHD